MTQGFNPAYDGPNASRVAAAIEDAFTVRKYPILDVIEAFPAVPNGEVTYSW